jgi:GNAT superfamily N-acetyltransferase
VSEVVRAVRDEDLPVLREIERASGERYREYGLDQVADDEPASIEVLADYAARGRAWVAKDADGTPVGYVLVDTADGAAHIEQVSVAPNHQGRGLGRALVEWAAQWATSQGMKALTLTTFGHIPWNRPLYEHLGFRVLADDGLGPGLRAVREVEAAHGLDPALRVVMRRELDRAPRATGQALVRVRWPNAKMFGQRQRSTSGRVTPPFRPFLRWSMTMTTCGPGSPTSCFLSGSCG